MGFKDVFEEAIQNMENITRLTHCTERVCVCVCVCVSARACVCLCGERVA